MRTSSNAEHILGTTHTAHIEVSLRWSGDRSLKCRYHFETTALCGSSAETPRHCKQLPIMFQLFLVRFAPREIGGSRFENITLVILFGFSHQLQGKCSMFEKKVYFLNEGTSKHKTAKSNDPKGTDRTKEVYTPQEAGSRPAGSPVSDPMVPGQ